MFRRDLMMKLDDQGLDAYDPVLLNTEMERAFHEDFLANLRESQPFVCLESEGFINQIACDMLIFVPQECTSMAKDVLTLLKRLTVRSLKGSLPPCSWLIRRINWS